MSSYTDGKTFVAALAAYPIAGVTILTAKYTEGHAAWIHGLVDDHHFELTVDRYNRVLRVSRWHDDPSTPAYVRRELWLARRILPLPRLAWVGVEDVYAHLVAAIEDYRKGITVPWLTAPDTGAPARPPPSISP